MVKFSCFRAPDSGDEFDVQSNHSGDSSVPPTSRINNAAKRAQHALFPNKRVLPRHDAKVRLKKLLNMKKDHAQDKERPIEDDSEYIILGKIYSELDATVDLASLSRNRATLSHLLPFLLNALLYGFNDQYQSTTVVASSSGTHHTYYAADAARNAASADHAHTPQPQYASSNNFYNRSGKKSSNFKVVKDPTQITLNGTSHLIKQQCERQLEQFLYQQAMNSVQFALECVWYLTTSLSMGPKESYHRTMSLLLGMESVVATSAPPGDLFKRAAVTETFPTTLPNSNHEIHTTTNTTTTTTTTTTTNSPINSNSNTNHNIPTSSTNNNDSSNSNYTPNNENENKNTNLNHSNIDTNDGSSNQANTPDRIEENGGLDPAALTSKKSVREVDLDMTGSGENDHKMQFNHPLKVDDEEKLQRWLEARRERSNVFHAQLDFVKCLTHISQELFQVEREYRRDVLRRELEKLNDHIPKNVFIPTDRRPHRILRIVPEAAHVFSTKERVPYLLVFEVEDLAPPPPPIGPVGSRHNSNLHLEHFPHGSSLSPVSASGHGANNETGHIQSPAHGESSGGRGATGPLKRIGSLGSGNVVKMNQNNSHATTLTSTASTVMSSSSAASKPPLQKPVAASKEQQDRIRNQPENKFEFSPDVTPEVNLGLGPGIVDGSGPSGSMGDLAKRESSFRVVDAQYAADKRPPDEELLKALGEGWSVKSERLKKASPFGNNPNWRLVSVIVKARDQLRQEMFAQRLIQEFLRIFESAGIPVWLRAYEILSTSHDSGLIETVTDAISIDSIKKQSKKVVTLQDYFSGRFGGKGTQEYKKAIRNFVQSMAGYSIIQYLLNIKDRHNGNLMIDAEGHLIHIDFGFLLSNSPGGNMEFEKSPFKLTTEMVQVMGGSNSSAFKLFKKLVVQGYLEACRYANKILLMVDIMYPGNESMPCFLQGREYVLENLRERFGVDLSRKEKANRMLRLIQAAHGNWTTKAYDHFQKVSLGIAK